MLPCRSSRDQPSIDPSAGEQQGLRWAWAGLVCPECQYSASCRARRLPGEQTIQSPWGRWSKLGAQGLEARFRVICASLSLSMVVLSARNAGGHTHLGLGSAFGTSAVAGLALVVLIMIARCHQT